MNNQFLKIAVLDDFQQVAHQYGDWQRLGSEVVVEYFHNHLSSKKDLIDKLQSFDVICLMRERSVIDQEVIDSLPQLKLIVTTGMWNAVLDIPYAKSKNICICGTDAKQSGTPELTWLLILALARKLENERHSIRHGGWQTSVGMALAGQTLGILGLGKIGSLVSKVANAFGMRVLAYSQNLTASDAISHGALKVDLNAIFSESDFVSIHLKLSERTHHFVGSTELALMKKDAYLINTSRGPLVNEVAVINALNNQQIAGYGVDTFDVEPLSPSHPFRSMSNVLATPHIGYVTQDSYQLFFTQIVENILVWRQGQPVRQLM
ncbi:MAG: D-2-hydroxyacid dehydrogenase family protein [Betaproteobacteria bacterium]|nr:D-2-hydroxyacid dehydrogenase family protein [Betaproteobacteria bacterium]